MMLLQSYLYCRYISSSLHPHAEEEICQVRFEKGVVEGMDRERIH
jgi:hypothetical protein